MGHGGEDSGSEEWEDDEEFVCQAGCGNSCILPQIEVISSRSQGSAEAAAVLLSAPEAWIPHINELAALILTAASTTDFEVGTRTLVLNCFTDLCEESPRDVRSCPTFAEVLPALVEMCGDVDLDPAWGASDQPLNEDEDELVLLASRALDVASLSLGGAYVLPILAPIIQTALVGDDPARTIAALTTVAAIGEGASKVLKPRLGELVAVVVPCLLHPVARVRHTACNAVGQLAIDFKPEPNTDSRLLNNFQSLFHAQVLPTLLELTTDEANPRVQAHAVSALSNFTEFAHKTVLEPYLDGLLVRLGSMLASEHRIVLEQTVTSIAATAAAANNIFESAYPYFMPPLKQLLSTPPISDDWKLLRGKAVECITLMGTAVRKDNFAPDVPEIVGVMREIADSLDEHDCERQYLLEGYARICQVIEEDFAPYLPHLMPMLIAALRLKPEIKTLASEEEIDDLPGGEDSWEIIPVGSADVHGVAIHSTATNLKQAAVRITQVFVLVGTEIAPYLKDIAAELPTLLSDALDSTIRVSAANGIPALLKCALDIAEDNPERDEGLRMFRTLLGSYDSDQPSDVQSAILTALSVCLEEQRLEVSGAETAQVCQALGAAYRTAIQNCDERADMLRAGELDDAAEDELDAAASADADVTVAAAYVIEALLKRDPEGFMPRFRELEVYLGRLMALGDSRTDTDRSPALIAYCALVETRGPQVAEHLGRFREYMLAALSSDDPASRQASAYLVGSLAKFGEGAYEAVVSEAVPDLLEILQAPEAGEDDSRVRSATENAAAAVFYVAKFLPGAGIPMPDALDHLIQILPFWDDLAEGNSVYNLLCEMLHNAAEAHHFPPDTLVGVFTVFAEAVLGDKAVFADGNKDANECTDVMRAAVEHVRVARSADFVATLAAMDADARAAFVDRFQIPSHGEVKL